jgi:hypothetical protein
MLTVGQIHDNIDIKQNRPMVENGGNIYDIRRIFFRSKGKVYGGRYQ